MNKTQYIPDIIGEIVAKAAEKLAARTEGPLNVYYDFGHHKAVLENLSQKEGNPQKPEKYPLIWLVTPFKEVAQRGRYAKVDLHFVIVNDTQPTYTMQERRDNVFLPILYPVLAELLHQFEKSTKVSFVPPLNYEKTDLQFARVDSTGKNLLNDYVDVIDLKLKEVQINNIC